MNTSNFFYQDRPLFGLDIGFDSLKVMQVDWSTKQPRVIGYGMAGFDPQILKDGVITDPETLAKTTKELFASQLAGKVSTRRVAMGVPASRTYSRIIKLPALGNKEIEEAVQLEAEQYIPMPIDQLYLDYTINSHTGKETDLFVVAAPKKLIDSYLLLTELLGLEVVAMETTVSATSRLFTYTDLHEEPTILIDFGSVSADITIFDKTMVVTGTSASGGDNFTQRIADRLRVTKSEAQLIKTKYGMDYGKKQREISEALQPLLAQLLKEIRRMIRYYEERSGTEKKISQVVTVGGGASMPGLNEHLTELLRLPTRLIDPWQHIGVNHVEPPAASERPLYSTVSGLALIRPREIFS
jgi:type IV pilus assembly protein PilM